MKIHLVFFIILFTGLLKSALVEIDKVQHAAIAFYIKNINSPVCNTDIDL